jgi:copper homeostasis protein
MVTFELAVFDPRSVAVAEKLRVPRIELCIDYTAGGLTPSMDDFLDARAKYSGEIFVMIRPRPGNFNYTDTEKSCILRQTQAFARAGADGFVSGFLTSTDEPEEQFLMEMLDVCQGKPFTFHRAFDKCKAPFDALDLFVRTGVSRILTSGAAASAPLGVDTLVRYQQYAGSALCILAGGGIRSENVNTIISHPEIREVHSAAIVPAQAGVIEFVADERELARLLAAISQ